ncbi:MAG: Na/Pi cotransporter family protein [Peptoniphilus sp.]|uniref:Na/Pi cotransporter family protein n=1 Tax=Peptoniphilus sp. TaxID=1971214 RepID=UPI002A765224|nr:Na/Pi cotransporter family protein [Peptoniphilus sp.]MDY2986278.1 Na/Pi cotransporter family protein [Peptoniphilus sp.]
MDQTITLAEINWQFIAGGLALFLYGIKLMGDSLTNFAGTKIRSYIEKYTSSPISAIFVGILMTGIMQSSSATTVIAISLVRAGLMNLKQAIGITLGANIGTTVTAILIGFDLDYLAYFIILVGVLIYMLSDKKRSTYAGEIIIGFGLLFIGLNMMGGALKDLKNIAGFETFVVKMSTTPVFGAIVGAIVTGVIQSSSAIVGIVQSLYQTDALTLKASLGLVFGANIGTTITALLASIGGTVSAKKTSLFHIIFNVGVSVVFLILITPYYHILLFIAEKFELNKMMTIAVGHFMFNFLGMLIFLPFISKFGEILDRLMPGKDELAIDYGKVEFDEQMIKNFPAGALKQARLAIESASALALQTLQTSQQYLETGDKKYFDKVNQIEEIVNSQDTEIATYLLKISKENLSSDMILEYSVDLQVQKNFERISDLAQNLAEYYAMIYDSGEKISEDAMEELKDVYDLISNIYINAVEVFKTNDISLYDTMKDDENKLNQLEYRLRESHFNRLTTRHVKATVETSLFVDIIGTLERIGDHAFNIARITFKPIKTHDEKADPAEFFE